MILLTLGIFIIVMIIIILLKIDLIPNSLMSNQRNFVLIRQFFTISTFVLPGWNANTCSSIVKKCESNKCSEKRVERFLTCDIFHNQKISL